jgi:hypothetical protein
LNECGVVMVNKQVLITLSVGKYKNQILCDVISMYTTHMLLGRPWRFDRKIKHDGFKNKYSLEKNGKVYTLAPLLPKQVYEDQMRLKTDFDSE